VPDTARTSHPRKWTILALVLVAECMDLLDGTVVNVAAPTIRVHLHASATQLQWIIGGYALAFAVVLITGGRLGDVYGRKRLFVLGAVGFVIASSACGLAGSAPMLIGCRLAQGGAAALLIPQGFGIVREAFAPAEQGSAFALFGPVIGLSAVLGPIVGGALIAANAFGSGWRLIFYVNLPLGLLAAIGAARLIPESRAPRRTSVDFVGTVLAGLGMALLVYPLIQGRAAGWPAWTYLMGAGSIAAFALFALWSRRTRRGGRDPLVEASIFAHRSYAAGLVMILVFFAGLTGSLLVLTLYLQFGEHFSPIHAGLTLAPFALGSAIGAGLAAGLLAPRFGRIALQVGAVIMGGGVFWLYAIVHANGLSTSTLDLIPAQLVMGVGLGMLVATLFDFVLAAVTDHEVGSASGVLNAVQALAAALGVAIQGTVFFATLTSSGFVSAATTCFLVQLAATPVLFLLGATLPKHARDPESILHALDAGDALVAPG
jgi:EmrB/QacA subfamily drug resistance transporter